MNIDPKQLQRLMQQMGIKTEEIRANRVIIEKDDEQLVLNQPSVVMMEAKGEKSFQISAKSIETKPVISGDDVKLVAEQSGASEENARRALEEAEGDVAEAIMKLKK